MEKQRIINKCKNQWDESNHNSNIWNIKHLTFKIVYHYYQRLQSTILNEVYLLRMPENAIRNFWCFFSGLVGRANNKPQMKQIISNGYKYQWYQSNLNNTNYNI